MINTLINLAKSQFFIHEGALEQKDIRQNRFIINIIAEQSKFEGHKKANPCHIRIYNPNHFN